MKKALYYALVGGYSPMYLGYLRVMAVTSEKRNQHGELALVYGRDDRGTSTNRNAQAIHFTYDSEEKAVEALKAATEADAKFADRKAAIDKAFKELERERRIEVNRVLGLHAIVKE